MHAERAPTELMGGTISVSGALGAGSTFTLRLPLAAVPPAAEVQLAAVEPAADRTLSQPARRPG